MVHAIFDPMDVTLDEFFQTGSGFYYQGLPYQRGYGMRGDGIGSIFRTLVRYILPVAKKAGKSVGKEALATSARILDNIAQGAELKETVLTEAKRGVKRLANRVNENTENSEDVQTGSGSPTKHRRVFRRSTVKSKQRKRRYIPKRQLLR